jgi:hypothetical protein
MIEFQIEKVKAAREDASVAQERSTDAVQMLVTKVLLVLCDVVLELLVNWKESSER